MMPVQHVLMPQWAVCGAFLVRCQERPCLTFLDAEGRPIDSKCHPIEDPSGWKELGKSSYGTYRPASVRVECGTRTTTYPLPRSFSTPRAKGPCRLGRRGATGIVLSALLSGSLPAVAATCGESEVSVPVVFSFANPEYQVDWVHRSLALHLEVIPDQWKSRTATLESGSLNAEFCLPARVVFEGRIPALRLHAGPRTLDLSSRPVAQGAVPTIRLLSQPDPDWLIVKTIEQFRYSILDRALAIEIEWFHGGFDPACWRQVILRGHYGKDCVAAGPAYEVPVLLTLSRKGTRLDSGDPLFQDLVERRVTYTDDVCGLGSRFVAELGTTGFIPGHTGVRVRYRVTFRSGGEVRTLRGSRSGGDKASRRDPDAAEWFERSLGTLALGIEVKGERVYGATRSGEQMVVGIE